MYQLSLHCVDSTAELNIAFAPIHERPKQPGENKILNLRVADLVENDSVRSIIDDRYNNRCHSEARQRDAKEKLDLHPIRLRRKETTSNEEGTTTADGRSEIHMDTTMCVVPLFGSGTLLHDDLFSLAQSAHMCPLHFFSAEGTSWQWSSRTPRPRSLLRNPMSITSSTLGTQCCNFYVTLMSAYPWKRLFTRKIWGESHFLVILHWTSNATKNEPAYEKTGPLMTSRTSQAGLEMSKRASGGSTILDNYDSQPLKFAQQQETGPFLIRTDRSIHDSYVRNSLNDL